MDKYSWDIDQFSYNEKQVSSDYDYIGETADIDGVFKSCVSFLKMFEKPKHLEGRTLLNMRVFGREAVTENTQKKLSNWASAVCSLDVKMKAS